jgi:hypothetical protein
MLPVHQQAFFKVFVASPSLHRREEQPTAHHIYTQQLWVQGQRAANNPLRQNALHNTQRWLY